VDTSELTAWLVDRARELGFASAGVAPAVPPPGAARLDEWLAAGYAGQMHYLADRREAYDNPGRVMEGARSVVMLSLDYQSAEPREAAPGEGRISRYAWGTADYHDVIHERLKQLIADLVAKSPEWKWRGVVDTAPIMEREFAYLAGLGWQGKHTLLLSRSQGSWFFLAALLTDAPLEVNETLPTDHCGTCTACLDACPTGAFPAPHLLDASRCISYLTIEHRGPIPLDLREGMGNWIFGCDICQEVCPWNRKSPRTQEPMFQPRPENNPVELEALFQLSDEEFRERFRRTPLWRARRRGLLRNAAIALGNNPVPHALPTLVAALEDEEPLVRGAVAWALGHYPCDQAITALERRQHVEPAEEVKAEIAASLGVLATCRR
jgi:epoxyqueuosine reductase